MKLPRLVVVTALALVVPAGAASANVQLVVITPTNGLGEFGRVPFDVPSAPLRITIRNDGTPVSHQEISPDVPYTIVATGGGFGTGETQFWDVVCTPTDTYPAGGAVIVSACGTSCSDDEWLERIYLECSGGLLDGPNFAGIGAYLYETVHDTVKFTNPGSDPVTITGFAAHDPAFSGVLASGTLPVTVAGGASVDVTWSFTPPGPGVLSSLDVLAGTSIVGRVQLDGLVRSQIAPAAIGLGLVPVGAVYTVPVRVRNSFPTARTITAMSSDLGDCSIAGLVGTTLAPGEFAHGMMTLTATTLGSRRCEMTVAFDEGQGDSAKVFVDVVDPTFSVTVGDATPGDGRLDFGTRKAGSDPVERTITITNLSSVARPVADCFPGSPPFEVISACPGELPANGSVELTVRFTPGTPGDVLDSVGVALNAFGPISPFVTARVVDHQLAFSTSTLAFAETMPGVLAEQHVTITNLADNPIAVPISVAGAGFATAAMTVMIEGDATADVTVGFQPTSGGSFAGTLELGVAGDPDHAVIALSGTGAATTPPPDAGTGSDGGVGGGGGGGGDGGVGGGDAGGAGGGGGCSAGGSAGGLMIAALAGLRRRRRRASR